MGAGSGPQTPAASGFNQNVVLNGVSSFSWTVPYAGPYVVHGKSTLPTLVNGAGSSGLTVTVNQNASPVYTGPIGAEGFKANISCSAFDVVQIALSSSNADDTSLTVKTAVEISQGVA